jgi:hypothetical protein
VVITAITVTDAHIATVVAVRFGGTARGDVKERIVRAAWRQPTAATAVVVSAIVAGIVLAPVDAAEVAECFALGASTVRPAQQPEPKSETGSEECRSEPQLPSSQRGYIMTAQYLLGRARGATLDAFAPPKSIPKNLHPRLFSKKPASPEKSKTQRTLLGF